MNPCNVTTMSEDITVTVKFLSKPIPATKLRLIKKDSQAASRVLEQLKSVTTLTETERPEVIELIKNILI